MSAQIQTEVSGTFNDMWPDTMTGQRHKYNEHDYIKWASDRQCYKCNAPTQWVSVVFELRICSPRCADALMDEYFYAVEAVGGVSVGFADEEPD